MNKKGFGGLGIFILIPLVGLFLLALTPTISEFGVTAASQPSTEPLESLFYANLAIVFWAAYIIASYVGIKYS